MISFITDYGKSIDDLRGFPKSVLECIAMDIGYMEEGDPPLTKPQGIEGLDKGIKELVRIKGIAYHCVYTIIGNVIYILHAFSSEMGDEHIDIIQQRYKGLFQ